MTPPLGWLDKLTLPFAPRWTAQRLRARVAVELLQRHYEGASVGRRTSGWHRTGADANAAIASIGRLRDSARDTVRNNGWADSAVSTIADQVVGWGIVGAPNRKLGTQSQRATVEKIWLSWADSTDCDADGRQNFYGLQKMVIRAVVEGGECLVRRRIRRPEDGFVLPLQLQLIEPEYLDSTKDAITVRSPEGVVIGRTVQGIEYDAIGRRTGYWMFREHPGANNTAGTDSVKIPASEILHVFKPLRPGQARGVPWLASVLLRLRDFDDYEDAALMKQKIAACLAVITSDLDGTPLVLGDDTTTPGTDTLEPGAIINAPPGRSISVVQPPTISEHDAYAKSVLRGIATGIGITYEDLTGDFSEVTFSSARMSRLRNWPRVEDARWRMLIPQFCDPVWAWVMQSATIMVDGFPSGILPEWTAPPMPMIEPDREGLAYQRNIRSGIQTLSEAIRERGYDPEVMLAEMKSDNALLDQLGLILDSDGRKMSQQGIRMGGEIPTLPERIMALGGLIRAGFEPADSLKAVDLPPIKHTGILPVTVQPEDDAAPAVPPATNGRPPPAAKMPA